MDLPNLKDDPYLQVLRPLVEAYLAFSRIDSRHIRSLRLTPSQFDVIVTLGDTAGLTCSQLSSQTLVTKGTLTGVLDRLETKGLIKRESVIGDKRRTKIKLTEKGGALFRRVFAAHIAFIRPFFARALSPQEVRDALVHNASDIQDGQSANGDLAAVGPDDATGGGLVNALDSWNAV